MPHDHLPLLTFLLRLLPGAIYAALYWRPDGKYHWAIIAADSPTSGQKLHATNLDQPAWRYARDEFGVASERKPLVILAQIGKTESGSGIDRLLCGIPIATPECDAPHPFTCRIWFREAVRVLITHSAVVCQSVDALEKELASLADADADGVALGAPWKLYDGLDSVRL